jgi:hypothetical protein
MQQGQIHSIVPYLIGGLIVVVILAFRLRSMSRSRPLRLEWLWVTPAILTALTVLTLYFTPGTPPPEGLDWAWLGGGFVLGAVIGWWRGKMMHITVDPETHALNTKASPAALIFIVGLLVVRSVLRGVAMSESSTLHLSVAAITGAFLTLAIGLFGVARLEMAIRATRLLKEARAAKAAATA